MHQTSSNNHFGHHFSSPSHQHASPAPLCILRLIYREHLIHNDDEFADFAKYELISLGYFTEPPLDEYYFSSAEIENTSVLTSTNIPNPFNPKTTIRYTIPEVTSVTIKIYDIVGREIVTLIDAHQDAGTHEIVWDASKQPSGVYFYHIQAGNYQQKGKMMVLK